MLAEGVALAPGAYEALFVGLGHTDDVSMRSVPRPARAARGDCCRSPRRLTYARAVRQFFSLRFWLTLAALGGLALVLWPRLRRVASPRRAGVPGTWPTPGPTAHRRGRRGCTPSSRRPGFAIVDGVANTDMALISTAPAR